MPLEQLPEILAVDQRHMPPLITRFKQGPRTEHTNNDERDPKEGSLSHFIGRSQDDRPYDLVKNVAVLRLRGYLAKRGWWCDTGFDGFSDRIRFAVDDFAVDTILIDCDSPGGSVYGCPDCADVVFAASKQKQIITVVNDLCASAALWVGSAAGEIVVTQSADIGSIGVYSMRMDYTEAMKMEGVKVEIIRAGAQKAWGSPYLPMSDAERSVMQAEVDAIYESFIQAVARHRGTDPERVRRDWADARIFTGQDAVNIGLADRVASFDQVLAELVGRQIINGDLEHGQRAYPSDSPTIRTPRRPVGFVRRR